MSLFTLVDPRQCFTEDDKDEKGFVSAVSRAHHREVESAVHTQIPSAGKCPFHCATEYDDKVKKNKFFKSLYHNLQATVEAGLTIAVDINTDKPMVWGNIRTNLTWSCESDDIEQYTNDLATAFASWSKACNVVFKKVDSNGFINIRWATSKEEASGRGVIAAAFFPGERERSIKLYELFKKQGKFRIAVLKHEIGHALGFRHEHIWFKDNPTEEKPISGGLGAQLVTEVDTDSIMSYNKLWEDDKAGLVTNLSPLDIVGSRLVYGAPATTVHMLL